MKTTRRSSDKTSRLYKQLADQMSAKNEEAISLVQRELLRLGEPVGVIIVGRAMCSVHEAENRRESGGAASAINELPEAQQVSVELQQNTSAGTPLQRPPGVDVYLDRPERAPVIFNELVGADGDDRPLLRRVQTVPTQATPEAEATEPTAVVRAANVDIHHEAVTDTTDDPRLISPAELGQSPSAGSGLQLRTRLSPAAVATRAILVLTAAVVVTAGTGPLWRAHRPADEYRAAMLQPAVASPPTLATAAVAAGFSEAALSAPVALGGLNVDTGPTFTMPNTAPLEIVTAIAAAPAIVPTEAPVTPSEVVDLLQGGDTLLRAGEVASAGLPADTRPTIIIPSAPPTEKAAVIAAAPAIVPIEAPVSPADVPALLQRGDALLAAGDVASARLFYERAAIAGDATAALRLGGSYDPLFLARAGLIGVHSNRTLAARWYRRAIELGAGEAKVLLKSTEAGQD